MTNDDIKKAAIELCTTEAQEEWLKDYGIHCFLDGARWRIENAWHDASEVPEINEVVLVEYKFGDQSFAYITTVNDSNWEYKSNRYNYTRWAYIADLMPDRKEEEK